MDNTCLIVDLEGKLAGWRDELSPEEFPVDISYAASVDEALVNLSTGSVAMMVVVKDAIDDDLRKVLEVFQLNVGALAEFQIIVSDPDPQFMAGVYEFGIESFLDPDEWQEGLKAFAENVCEVLADDNSAEAKMIKLTRTVRSQDKAAIAQVQAEMGDLGDYDYRAAYANGKAAEASGNYEKAVESFSTARSMNKMFRPSSSKLGETLLITGKTDQAIELFEELEKTNKSDFSRKTQLASAYVEKGDFDKAESFMAQAKELSPTNPKVKEVKAQILLCTGKIQDALKEMDGMSEVGPFFAAKLNEMGIKLSQQGEGKSAITLYQKAYKIVREDLRYKISLNAALACRRLNRPDLSLKYLDRCEQEFGGSFPKLEKIRAAVKQMMAKLAQAKKGS